MRTSSRSGAGRPATVQDVAELARVSTATVSRVLNGSPRVSAEARNRVHDAVRRLDYVASMSAKTMQPGSRSMAWGLLVDDVDPHYFGRLVAELDRAAQAAGSTLFTASTQKQAQREESLLREMRARRMDGILVVPTPHDDIRHRPEPGGPPIVYIDRIPQGFGNVDVVTFDYYQPIRAEMLELWRRGHRRFAFVGGNVAADPGSRRFAAWSDFLHEHGAVIDPALVRTGNASRADAAESTREIAASSDAPTVIVTTNGDLLLGVLEVVVEQRLQVEVLASEEVPAGFLSPVPLHMVTSDPELMARTAAHLLQQRIDGVEDDLRTVTYLPTATIHFGTQEQNRP